MFSHRNLFVTLFLAGLGVAPAHAATVAIPEPIARWSFETLENGLSPGDGPQGKSATLTGEASLVPGAVGFAIALKGEPLGQLRVPTSFGSLATGPFTVEFWFRPRKTEGYGVCLDAGGRRGLVIRTNNSGRMTVSAGGQWNAIIPEDKYMTGRWLHCAVTFDGQIIRLHENGAETGAFEISAPLQFAAQMQIGAVIERITLPDGSKTDALINAFNGELDELKIYDVALTLAQIQELAHRLP